MEINKYFIPLAVVLITYANGIVSTKFLNDKIQKKLNVINS